MSDDTGTGLGAWRAEGHRLAKGSSASVPREREGERAAGVALGWIQGRGRKTLRQRNWD